MKLVKLFMISLLAVALFSCNDDEDSDQDPDPQVDCAQFGSDEEVQAAADNFVEAANVYYQDPTEGNCNAYFAALDNYFETIDAYIDACYNQQAFEEWQEAIEEWRAERDQLDCSD